MGFDIAISAKGYLDAAEHRATLFTRLIDEHTGATSPTECKWRTSSLSGLHAEEAPVKHIMGF